LGTDSHALKLVTCFLLTFQKAVAGGFRRRREFLCANGQTLFQRGQEESFDSVWYLPMKCNVGGEMWTAEL